MPEPASGNQDEWPPRWFQEGIELGLTPARAKLLMATRRPQYPPAFGAIAEDARVFSAYRVEALPGTSPFWMFLVALRLSWKSDAFLALVFYRFRCRLARFHVPLLPAMLHRLSMMIAQVCIGDPVLIQPGIYIPHGQIVLDGLVDIGKYVVLAPWVGIGLDLGHHVGAKVGPGVYLATGSKVIGPVRIGEFSQVAANSVVIHDVPERTTVAGSPARVIGPARLKVTFPRREAT